MCFLVEIKVVLWKSIGNLIKDWKCLGLWLIKFLRESNFVESVEGFFVLNMFVLFKL